MKGFKAINKKLPIINIQEDGVYSHDGSPTPCLSRLHFWLDIGDIFETYEFNKDLTDVYEIKALGHIIGPFGNQKKYVTNTLKIIRKLPWSEVLELTEPNGADILNI